ncbi:energy transducer TonB [Caballeronia sordidicola]|nr:energy transducer TonB [Caballeronia sordidicola]
MRHIIPAAGIVLAAHIGVLILILYTRDQPVERPIESHTISAELISETPAPVAAPAALKSSAPPQPAPPKSHPRPHPAEHHVSTVKSTPTPAKLSDTPSSIAPATPADSPPTPATQATPAATLPAAPVISRETMTINAPKDVAHLDCDIAKPAYPPLSKRMNETGTAVVHFVVGLSGNLEDIKLQKSSGYSRLDNTALEAMHASACHPYMEDGKPVRAAYSQPFAFNFSN